LMLGTSIDRSTAIYRGSHLEFRKFLSRGAPAACRSLY
jgi:uncharacterized protein YjbJ (UPF0337 family)